jgi:gamma-glutamyltranspeptidase / glutathione hydrolase
MRLRVAVLLVLVAVCGWSQQRPRPIKFAARGTHGAVAGGSESSTEAGMRMYYAGGNAVDAGIATMLAASIAEFSHFGLGGESPILVKTKDGKVHAIAGVGTMPALGTADFYRNHVLTALEIVDKPGPNGLKDWVPVAGPLATLVPGMVDAAIVALKEYGTKSFAEVLQPAIELADSCPIDEMREWSLESSEPFLAQWPASKRVFLARGTYPKAGELLHQPDLARTLRNMADVEKKALAAGLSRAKAMDAVRDYFYRGDIAHRIDAFSKANGGLLRYEDMAAFHLEPEEPVSTTFHGYTVYKPGFWSQGPSMIEALNILEGFDLGTMQVNSADYIHTVVEALKLAYADRDTYYGDPKFSKIPADILLSKAYGAERRKLIGETASLEFRPGKIGDHPPLHPSQAHIARYEMDPRLKANDTTCVDAIDADGTAISITPSGAWMPSYIAGDTGIPLTERAQSFLLVPGHPNELAPGKRPRVTLSPTIVIGPNKNLVTLSTPGGDQQDQSLLQVLFNALEYGMNAQLSVERPRFQSEHLVESFDNHSMKPGSLLLDERIPAAVAAELKRRGHLVEIRPRTDSGSAPVIIRFYPNGVIEAGADPFYYRFAQAW